MLASYRPGTAATVSGAKPAFSTLKRNTVATKRFFAMGVTPTSVQGAEACAYGFDRTVAPDGSLVNSVSFETTSRSNCNSGSRRRYLWAFMASA